MQHHTMNVLNATIDTVRKCGFKLTRAIGTSLAVLTSTVLLGAIAVSYASTDAVRSGHQKHAPLMLPSTSPRRAIFFNFRMRSSDQQVYRWVALFRWTPLESLQV